MTLLASLLIGFSSCSDEANVSVSRVCTQTVDDTETVLEKVRLGEKIRIEGSGFSGLKAVYCNGVIVNGINPSYVTDNVIIFTIPKSIPTGSSVENPEDLNTIRIVTKDDDFTFPFLILDAAPKVTDISNTMARAGEVIEIYGTDLKDIEKVVFPGGIETTDFTETADRTTLRVAVPEGIGSNSGAITVLGANGGAYTYNNFNFISGLFLPDFEGEIYKGGRTSISKNLTESIPQGIDGPKSPDVYRAIPAEPGEFPASEKEIGGFNFDIVKAINKVLEASAGNKDMQPTTSCSKVAFQCDVYLNVPWQTGTFRLEINGKRISPLPWLSEGKVIPVDCSGKGWITVSWPLSSISDYESMTLDALVSSLAGKSASFYFKCGKFQDASGNWFAGEAMSDAQMFIGNFRLVPYVHNSYNNN